MKDWTRWHRPQRRLMPKALMSWLTNRQSLTRRLQRHVQNEFSVQLLGNSWIRPLIDEANYLDLSPQLMAYQREVLLKDGERTNVYARTVIPKSTFDMMPHRFNSLGNQPLGELLFTDPSVVRGPIQIACLKPQQWLYEMALLEEDYRPEALWGRRSLFYLSGKKLLVNEIFLPTLLGR